MVGHEACIPTSVKSIYKNIYIYVYKERGEGEERKKRYEECAAMSVTENCSDRIETRSHPVHFENNLL